MTKYEIEIDERYPDRRLGGTMESGHEVSEAEEAFLMYAAQVYAYGQLMLKAKESGVTADERATARELHTRITLGHYPPPFPHPFLEAGNHSG